MGPGHHGRREGRLRELAEQLADQHGVKVQPYPADLADPGDLARLEQVLADTVPDLLGSGLADRYQE